MTEPGPLSWDPDIPLGCPTCGVDLVRRRCPSCGATAAAIMAWEARRSRAGELPAGRHLRPPTLYQPLRPDVRVRRAAAAVGGAIAGAVVGGVTFVGSGEIGAALALAFLAAIAVAAGSLGGDLGVRLAAGWARRSPTGTDRWG